MGSDCHTSREDWVALEIHQKHRHGDVYDIVDAPFAARKLRAAMVWQDGPTPRVLTGVSLQKKKGGTIMVLIETAGRTALVAVDSMVMIWHMDQHKPPAKRKPFIMTLPTDNEFCSTGTPPTPLAQDAAGIVPVWIQPKRVV